jgi:hypothetical protein
LSIYDRFAIGRSLAQLVNCYPDPSHGHSAVY